MGWSYFLCESHFEENPYERNFVGYSQIKNGVEGKPILITLRYLVVNVGPILLMKMKKVRSQISQMYIHML